MITESMESIDIKPISVTSSLSNRSYFLRNSKLLWAKVKASTGTTTNANINDLVKNNKNLSTIQTNSKKDVTANTFTRHDISTDDTTKNTVLKELGSNGEIILGYDNAIEVYDWMPHESLRFQNNYDQKSQQDSRLSVNGTITAHSHSHSTSLHLVAKFDQIIDGGILLGLYPLITNSKRSHYVILTILKDIYKEIKCIIVDVTYNKVTPLKIHRNIDTSSLNFTVKANDSDKYFVVADNTTGYLAVYSKETYNLVESIHPFKSKVMNDKPVFDLKGNWLIYNASSKDKIMNDIRNSSAYNLPITKLRLAKTPTLSTKIFKGLSKTTIDSVLLLSEMSHTKLKKYFNNNSTQKQQYEQQQKQNQQKSFSNLNDSTVKSSQLNNVSENGLDQETNLKPHNFREILVKMFNTLNMNSNYLVLVDLTLRGKPIFYFSPPDGCSQVSLSSYDLALTTVTNRGDDIYLWDFTNFKKELILMDKFNRGKTAAVVDNVIICENQRSVILLSKLNGSIHCFKNEYMDEYYPISGASNTFSLNINDWCLSNLGFKKIGLIEQDPNHKDFFDDIVAIGDNGHLFTIKLKSGLVNWKYELPTIPEKRVPNYLTNQLVDQKDNDDENGSLNDEIKEGNLSELFKFPTQSSFDPLSQVEIETCKPYTFLNNFKRVHFSRFNDERSLDIDEKFSTFGHGFGVSCKEIKFSNKADAKIKFQKYNDNNIKVECDNATNRDTKILDFPQISRTITSGDDIKGLQDIRIAMEGSLLA